MPETISLPALRAAIENLRRRADRLSPLERMKLNCLEDNLRILSDIEHAARARLLLVEYECAIVRARSAAQSAANFAFHTRHGRVLQSPDSRRAIDRSWTLLRAVRHG